MIAVISPAKTLDLEPGNFEPFTKPRFPKETKALVEVMKTKAPDQLKSLMSISDDLANLNFDRYQKFSSRYTAKNSKPSIHTFKGDVYIGLEVDKFSQEDIDFAQGHLRILSGLYGLLRPMDLIQPYRLEMGTRLAFDDYKTLYGFWDNKIVDLLNKDLKKQGDNVLVNLASNEYFKSVNLSNLKGRMIDVQFKDFSSGKYKVVSFFAKKARGMMSKFMIQNRLTNPEDLLGFSDEGYSIDTNESTQDSLVFKRG